MDILFIILLIILIIAIISTLSYLIIKIETQYKNKSNRTLQDILDEKAFYPSELIFVNKHLSLALNKGKTKIAIIKNFNPNNPYYYNYEELALSFIEKIENNLAIKIYYLKNANINILNIYPANNEIKKFVHEIFKLSLSKRIESRYPQHRFTHFSTSDWECNYVWAYSKFDNTFAYFKMQPKPIINKINLRKEFFTIDTKYKYLEIPLFGMPQQLFIYEDNFLEEIYAEILNSISNKCATIVDNSIYYDSYSNVLYLTQENNSLQSIFINKTQEIYYKENRVSFDLFEEDRTIHYSSNKEQLSDLEDFITNLNLRKIAQNFNQKSDKLINTTPSTKLIIDATRNRIVYCANLNKLAKFSYLFLPLDSIHNIQIEKTGSKFFVRFHTKDKEIIDVTCDKKEVAQYIESQIVRTIG